MLPGTPGARTHDYVRHGTSSLFAALDIATGKVIGCAAPRATAHRVPEVPAPRSTTRSRPTSTCTCRATTTPPTRRPAIKRWLLAHPRFHVHFTPDRRLLAQPGRALVRRTDHQAAPARHPPLRRRARTPTSAPGSTPGTTTPALRLDQDRRPDPRSTRHAICNELMTQDTSVPIRKFGRRRPQTAIELPNRAASAASASAGAGSARPGGASRVRDVTGRHSPRAERRVRARPAVPRARA